MDSLSAVSQDFTVIKDKQTAFEEECKDLEAKFKDEVEEAKSALVLFLEANPSARLSNGKFLRLHENTSKLALNSERILEAVGRVTKSCITNQKELGEKVTDTELLVRAIETELEAECKSVSKTPRINNNAPKDLPKGVFTVNAPGPVDDLAVQLDKAQDNIKKIKKHKKDGKAQCAPKLGQYEAEAAKLMATVAPGNEPVTVKLEPPPKLLGDGGNLEALPGLPLGGNVVANKKNTKRKASNEIKATVEGLERPIKIQRKLKKPPSARVKKVTIEEFVDELGFVIDKDYPSIQVFLSKRKEVAARAVQVFEAMTSDRKDQAAKSTEPASVQFKIV